MKTRAEILSFIRGRKVSFIGSVADDGYPNMKAMLPPRRVEENGIYFTTNTSSMRTKQYQNNDKACVYFYRKGLFRYVGVMLTGKMQVMTDDETKRSIWHKGDTMYYSKGVTDPDYCVLKFVPERCRHYCDLKTQDVEWK